MYTDRSYVGALLCIFIFFVLKLTDDVKKEKDKEPEKTEKLEPVGMMRKKGFELERKDSDDSDEVCIISFGNSTRR